MHTSSRLICVIVGGLTGAFAALAADHLDTVDVSSANAVYGGIAGALCGVFVWALWRPRQRIPRVAPSLVAVNCAAWLLFLIANDRTSDGGTSIRAHRAELDREAVLGWPNGMTFITHPPTLLAGRSNSWGTLSEKPLALFASPAVVFGHEQIVPTRYWQTGATVPESDWIAVVAFFFSTAWWVSAGSMLRFLKNRQVGRVATLA
jgi:hypothetical protein